MEYTGRGQQNKHYNGGARWGVGVGYEGKTYAIPTKSEYIERTLTIEEIKPYVDEFIWFATNTPSKNYLVTEIGCGLAGHKVGDMALLFKKTLNIENIYLPSSFNQALNKCPGEKSP